MSRPALLFVAAFLACFSAAQGEATRLSAGSSSRASRPRLRRAQPPLNRRRSARAPSLLAARCAAVKAPGASHPALPCCTPPPGQTYSKTYASFYSGLTKEAGVTYCKQIIGAQCPRAAACSCLT